MFRDIGVGVVTKKQHINFDGIFLLYIIVNVKIFFEFQGKGDTTGGCKCGVNGIKCHAKCNYCH